MARRPSRPKPPRSARGPARGPARTPGGADLTKARAIRAMSQGDAATALQLATEALRKLKTDAELIHLRGAALSRLGSLDEALAELRRAAALAPKSPAVHVTLAQVYRRLQRFDEMNDALARALKLDPDATQAIHLKAQALRDLGEYDQAQRLLAESIQRLGPQAPLLYSHAELCEASRDTAPGIASARALLAQPGAPPDVRRSTTYLLARLLDIAGEHVEAIDAAAEANAMSPAGVVTSAERITRPWTPERLAAIPHAADPDPLPILVVGMPRSGTTLVEQMLAAHPRIGTAGECNALPQIRKGVNPANLDRATVDKHARAYLDRLREAAPGADRVVDKLPGNYMNLGLVSRLTPAATVIHCVRDPRDTCVSCFFQNFGESHTFSRDLALCGEQFAEYLAMMDHWRGVLDIEILDVPYAELVAEPERWIRAMLQRAGMEFDEACLRHHDSARAVTTASSAQVRRPVYTSSVARWRRYADRLDPLIDTLRARGVALDDGDSA